MTTAASTTTLSDTSALDSSSLGPTPPSANAHKTHAGAAGVLDSPSDNTTTPTMSNLPTPSLANTRHEMFGGGGGNEDGSGDAQAQDVAAATAATTSKAPQNPLATDATASSSSSLSLPSTTSSSSSSSSSSPRFADMSSLIDVVWGGRLASMVICEGCRHVSHNYEDFLDISLPLRPEDALTASAHGRRHRMRFVPDRWKRAGGASSSGASGLTTSNSTRAREDILMGTLDAEGCPVNGATHTPSASSSSSPFDKKSHRLSRRLDGDANGIGAGSDPSLPPPHSATTSDSSSNSWSAWAASLGRSRSARPSSAKGFRHPAHQPQPAAPVSASAAPASASEADTIDMPDVAALALSPRPATTQPLPADATVSDNPPPALANGLHATLEAKTRGSRDLLTALSNASRANSRAGSRTRGGVGSGGVGVTGLDSRSVSPGVERTQSPSSRIERGRGVSGNGNGGGAAFLQPPSASQALSAPREPSRQARYIVRVFSEASDVRVAPHATTSTTTHSQTSADAFRAQVREAQAKTGLVTAIRAFTSSEVLADDNAFHCRRCWRRLNPPQGDERERLRRHRIRKGKDASGSEDSEDDDDQNEDGAATATATAAARRETSSGAATPPPPTRLVAPQPKRAMDSLLRSEDTDDADDEDDVSPAQHPAVRTQIVVDPAAAAATEDAAAPPTPPSSSSAMVEILEAGAQTPVSRPASAANRSQDGAQTPDAGGGSVDEAASEGEGAAGVDGASTDKPDGEGKGDGDGDGDGIPSSVTSNDSSTSTPGTSTHFSSANGVASPAPAPASLPRPRPLPASRTANGTLRTAPPKVKRSTQSIPRRALKRYLISDLPAVLPFHLKRFHAEGSAAKTSSIFGSAFSSSLKKIDDLVTYPLYLDMAEWMAPPREEYDRYGRLKPTSHPDAWAQRHRQHRDEGDEARAGAESTASASVSNDMGLGGGGADSSTGESIADHKRKGSRWHRPFSRAEGAGSRVRTGGGSGSSSTSATFTNALRECGSHRANGPSPLYRLYAVTNHQGGTTNSGHYTSYILSDRVTGGRALAAMAAAKRESGDAPLPDGHGRDVSATSTSTAKQDSHGGGNRAVSSSDTAPAAATGRLSTSSASANAPEPFDPSLECRSWVWCSDSDVRPVSEEAVLKNKDAYILYYERVQ